LACEFNFAKMRARASWFCRLVVAWSACSINMLCQAQDLSPHAYVITPVHSNAINLTYSFFDGNILFDGSLPITGARGRVNVSILSYYHSFSFFGRSANFTAFLPYGVGTFQGEVVGAETRAYRSGLLPANLRLSINLVGGPAMKPDEFGRWRQRTILGVSIRVVPNTGQYDPTKLLNFGTNRWAFKPELGYSTRRGHWILDAYGGVWFFTTNPEFFSHNQFNPGTSTQAQSPTGSFEGHLSYDFKPRLWVSLDGNYWFGGASRLNGVVNPSTTQRNSRIGITASIPLTSRQSLKCSYSDGAYIRYGGNFQNISLGWQYSWLGRPN
jgi:hypothetical protein